MQAVPIPVMPSCQEMVTNNSDRSNGFEKKWLQAQNTAARNIVEFNKWSAEDM